MGGDSKEGLLSRSARVGLVVAVGSLAAIAGIALGLALLFGDDPPEASDDGPAGEVENPFGPQNEDETPTQTTTPNTTVPSGPGTTNADGFYADELENDDPFLGCEDELSRFGPDSLLLYRVAVQVTGIGPGGNYVWVCGDEQVWAEEELPGTVFGHSGECTFLTPNFEEKLAVFLLTGGDAAFPDDAFNEVFFSAGVRVSNSQYISIGHDEQYGITTGGFYIGDGSREGSQQWIIEEGTMSFGTKSLSSSSYNGRVEATWSGMSIDDFSGEEAEGHVSVKCDFFYSPPSD